ncbi:MAG: hypothetical protein WB783_15535 [Arenicellales bacterium]
MGAQHIDRRRTSRIPVDAVLEYRATGMDYFRLGRVANVSTLSLEMRMDEPLEDDTVVTILVRPEGSAQNAYRAVGEVKRKWRRNGAWVHVISPSSRSPWSPMFIYNVLCSTFEAGPGA